MDRELKCPRPFFETFSDLQRRTNKRTAEIVAKRRELMQSNEAIYPDPDLPHEELVDLDYAIEGLLSQYLWEYVRTLDLARMPVPKGQDFWQTLYDDLTQGESDAREQLTRACLHPEDSDIEPTTRLDQLFQGFIRCKSQETGTIGTGFPSMAGLFHFGLHQLQAIVEKYELETQARMPFEEFLRFATNPDTYRLLLEMQSNTHEGITKLHGVLTGRPYPHRDDEDNPTAKPFVLSRLNIDMEAGCVRPKDSVWFATSNRLELLNNESEAQQRDCPMIYAGYFPQIWRWLTEIVSYQYYSTRYPQVTDRKPSKDAFAERIRAELKEKGLIS